MPNNPKSLLTASNTITLILGIIAGIIAPIIGLFIGLQVSSTLGTILVAPFIAVAIMFDTYLGYMHGFARLLGLGLSILTYVALAFGVRHLFRLVMRR